MVNISAAICMRDVEVLVRRRRARSRSAPWRRRGSERVDGIGAAPEQRQRHRDQPGAQHAEQRQDALDGVGDLDRRRPRPTAGRSGAAARRSPTPCDRPAHRSGAAAAPSVKLSAVGRIDQRQRVRPPSAARRNRSSSVARAPAARVSARSCEDQSRITLPRSFRLAPPGFRQIADERGLRPDGR